MCIVIGHSAKGAGSFVATDTRVMCTDGSHEDVGGKIVSTGSGWATGGAPITYDAWHVGMSALRDAGPIPMQGRYPVCDAIGRAHQTVSSALAAVGLEFDPTGYIIVIEPGSEVINLSGARVDEVGGAVGLPPDIDNQKDWADAMLAQIRDAGADLASRIRTAARHFVLADQTSKCVSGVMEVGYLIPTPEGPVRGFLRGEATEMANAEATEILELFRAEPSQSLPQESLIRRARGVVSSLITSSSSTSRNRCKLYQSASLTTTTATEARVGWDSENYDSNALHDTTTNNARITVPTGGNIGLWRFSVQGNWDANGTGYRQVRILKNATTEIARATSGNAGGAFVTVQFCQAEDDAPAVGDYYEVYVQQGSGGNLAFLGSNGDSFFSARHEW